MSDESNRDNQDKHEQCKPTKRRDNPTRLSDINGLQVATELQGFRYLTIPSSESSRSISMSVIHNGNTIITRSFRPGQNRKFDDALLDCDTEAKATETADNGFPAPSANANPWDILNARTSGPPSLSNVALYQSARHEVANVPQASTPLSWTELSATRTMLSEMDNYFDGTASSMTATALNSRELPFGQYSNFMQLANFPSARNTIPTDSLNPNNGFTQGQNLLMDTRQVASCPHSSISSHQIGQQRQQIPPQLLTGAVFAYHTPSNVSDHQSHGGSSSFGYSTETGTHSAYSQAPGSTSTAAPSRMQAYYSPSEVTNQGPHSLDSSPYGIGIATQSSYDSSPGSYSLNSTGHSQMEAYDSSFYQASYSNELYLTNNLYAMAPASLGSTPFSTARTSLSPDNGFEHTETTMQILSTPSPILGLNNMLNFASPPAPLLSFPTIIPPDKTASDINFHVFDPSNSYLSGTQWHQ